MSYRLTRRCERDLANVHLQGSKLFGFEQADRYQASLKATFELLAANPRLARERTELRRPVRLHPFQSHVIVYVEQGDDILIVRVLHARSDWDRYLRS